MSEVKNYVTEIVEEELYADSSVIAANSVSPVKVQDGRIPNGYNGVAVGLACTQSSSCRAFLKIKDKQHYPNGLNTAGLGGLTDETLLLVKIEEGASWELGFTNSSGSEVTIDWRLRIRLFKG
jgi:hypothetical protein